MSPEPRPERELLPEPGSALELVGVVRTFGDVTALGGVDLAVARGEVVGLLGHNGAGKTTTVRILAGLLTPDAGDVRVVGLDPTVRGPQVRRTVGVLPARPIVDDRLTARQNLRFAADVFGLPQDGLAQRIEQTLALFDLADRGDERVGGYSSGMRQRLSLARVLLPDPSVLLLDEPTSALDPIAARQVRRLLARLARQRDRTVVICTHDLPEAEQLCARVVVLERGSVIADGSPPELAARYGTAGIRVQVAPADLRRAATVIEELTPAAVDVPAPGVLNVQPLARGDVPAVLRALVAAGIDVYELRRLEPTLEDVYLAIHGAQGDSDAVGGEPRPGEQK